MVDIWQVSHSFSDEEVATLETLLNADERERCTAFRFPRERRRYALLRGALRSILSRYLTTHASQLAFAYRPSGKPLLAYPRAARRLQFNLSHCEDLTLIAVGLKSALGVDVEKVRKFLDL